MKGIKFFIASLLVVVGIGATLFYYKSFNQKPSQGVSEPTPEVLGVPRQNLGIELEWNDSAIRADYVRISDTAAITLLPNFDERKTSREIFEANACSSLISGGFYTLQGAPTGLFISEGQLKKKFLTSEFSDGVYSINDFETPRITRQAPRDPLRLALQAGPLLIENSFTQSLSLKRDEEARRIVVAVTGENETIFVVFYNPTSVFAGPKLDDLPDILASFQEKIGISFADAMNLDGGTASAFINGNVTLGEASPVGSFFCIREPKN